MKKFWQRYRKNRPASAALAVLSVIVFFSLFAGVIAPPENGIRQNPGIRLQGPSREHIFGTDDHGRDLFTRIIHGGRISLLLGFGAAALSMAAAFVFGSIAGYAGGLADEIIMRITDAFLSIPYMLLALAITAALGPGTKNLFIAIVVSYIPNFTRVVRSIVLTIVENDYITAARVNGLGDIAIIRRHILRNAIGSVLVQAALSVTGMILVSVGLSFIGLGISPPSPEWGAMLSSSREFLRRAPHLMFFPAAAIVTTALSLNLAADGLRDALE
ncbi:MAG: ABC transporter permease [Treponema sp.]|jgi:peptide/nickel transport system permease protein|nr:ABC transporter permease [Treponema sp.]